MKKARWILMSALLLALASLFAGCGDDSTSSSDTGTYFHIPFPGDSYFERVESISLTVTAADIDSPITASLPDSLIADATQADIKMTVPAGDSRQYDLQAYDSDDQCLYRNQGDFDIASGRTDISIILRPNGMGGPTRVKLFRNVNPWDAPSQPESVLVALGFSEGNGINQYQIFNSSQMGSVVLTPGVDLVILQSCQDTTFYWDYDSQRDFFDDFVNSGGALLFLYSPYLDTDGQARPSFPLGIEFTPRPAPNNDVIIADHPITVGLEAELNGYSASHGYFTNLPTGTLVLTVDSDSLEATLVVFNQGNGTTILSSQPVELWRYYRTETMGGMLSRFIRFTLGYDPTPGEIPGPNLLPPGNSSSAISASER